MYQIPPKFLKVRHSMGLSTEIHQRYEAKSNWPLLIHLRGESLNAYLNAHFRSQPTIITFNEYQLIFGFFSDPGVLDLFVQTAIDALDKLV